MENMIELAKSLFKNVLSEFYYPSIPDPKILNIDEDWIIRFDESGWRVIVNVGPLKRLDIGEFERYIKNIWRRVIAYYLVCPYDQETAIRIFTAAIVRSDEFFGRMAANLLIEFINTSYLYNLFGDEIVWFYRKTFELFGEADTLNTLILLVLKSLVGKDFGSSKLNSRDELNSLALEIYKILINGGIMTRETWALKAGEIAKKIYDFYNKNIKSFDVSKDINTVFQRDLSEAIFFKPIQTGGSLRSVISNLEDIIDTIFSVERSIVKVSPAIKSLKIDVRPKDLLRYWYRARARENISLKRRKRVEKEEVLSRILDSWSITDPVEELDLYASLSIFPKPIPNLTTKKWVEHKNRIREESFEAPNLLIIIDSSGSMRFLPGWIEANNGSGDERILKNFGIKYAIGSKFDIALVAAFSALEVAVNMGKKVAAINFSGKPIICDWTQEREKIEDCLMIFQNNGTEFPSKEVLNLVDKSDSRVSVIILTDAEIYNETEAINCMQEITKRGHLVYIFHVEREYSMLLDEAKRLGVEIVKVSKLEELPKQISEVLKEVYRF